jgi:hypothetical protein
MGDWQRKAIVGILAKHLFMKSIRFSLMAILVVFTMATMAQDDGASKFYVKAYGGYGLLSPGSYKLESYTSTDTDPDGAVSISKKGLGSGIRAGAGIGVIASDFLNIGVDVEYLVGAALKSKSAYSSGTYASSSERQFEYTCISVIPHVIFKAISKPDYLVYNKVGILLNLPFDLKVTQNDTSSNSSVSYTGKTVTQGAYSIKMTAGLNVALGVQVRVNDKLRAFGEVFGNFLTVVPETYHETYTSVGQNGASVSTSTGVTDITYIKEGDLSYISNSVANDKGGTHTVNKYDVSVSSNKYNMNSIGVNIGVTFRF